MIYNDIQIKNRIKTRFNRAWKTYDHFCSVQKAASTTLINMLLQQSDHYGVIADFACGTGINTQPLINQVSYDQFYAIDFSKKLLDIAKKRLKGKQIKYIYSDFDKSLFPHKHLNLILSNMGLQWSLELIYTFKLFHTYLNDDGVFAFSIPLSGTFLELKSAYKNTCHSSDNIQSLLKQSGFKLFDLHHQVEVKEFDTQFNAIQSIKAIGANCSTSQHSVKQRKGLLPKQHINNMFIKQNIVTLTYNLGIFLAKKA